MTLNYLDPFQNQKGQTEYGGISGCGATGARRCPLASGT
jgi:hypothetical protein